MCHACWDQMSWSKYLKEKMFSEWQLCGQKCLADAGKCANFLEKTEIQQLLKSLLVNAKVSRLPYLNTQRVKH